MNWSIEWTRQATQDMRHLDRLAAIRVVHAVERLAETGQGDVIRLTALDPEWRLRVGGWRVRLLFDYENKVVRILHVLPRGSAYRE